MTLADRHPFFSSQGLMRPIRQNVVSYQCDYDVEYFDQDLFGRYGVEYSCSLDRAVTKRKAEFLAGRFAAQQALGKLGVNQQAIHIGDDRCPIWPEGVVGSITHTNTRAICSVALSSRYDTIGIDLEDWIAPKKAVQIKDGIISAVEERYLEWCPSRFERLLTIAFSAKESLFKALYPFVRSYFDFHSAEITRVDVERNNVQLTLVRELTRNLRRGRVFDVHCIEGETSVFTIVSIPVEELNCMGK